MFAPHCGAGMLGVVPSHRNLAHRNAKLNANAPDLHSSPHLPSNLTVAISSHTSEITMAFKSGSMLMIQGQRYELTKELGSGAYGSVWQGKDEKCVEVAIKVMKNTPANLYEAEVLEQLTKKFPETDEAAQHFSRYIGHTKSSKHVHLAMAKVTGILLDEWLYGCNEKVHKTIDPDILINGPLPKSKCRTMSSPEACSVAACILKQLCPVLSQLQSIVFHRDISNHNIMVSSTQSPIVDVSLIDFGLAISSLTWSRSWKSHNVAGDPRYWTPAAWMKLLSPNGTYLATHPNQGFLRQYQQRLDHFSLGILVLEVYFSLCNDGNNDVLLAWKSYWKLALEMFQDAHKLKETELTRKIVQNSAIPKLEQKLQTLRNTLRKTSRTQHAAASLFAVCADLIDEWGSLSWTQVAASLEASCTNNEDLEHTIPVNDRQSQDLVHEPKPTKASQHQQNVINVQKSHHQSHAKQVRQAASPSRQRAGGGDMERNHARRGPTLTRQETPAARGYQYKYFSPQSLAPPLHGVTTAVNVMNVPNRLITLHGYARRF